MIFIALSLDSWMPMRFWRKKYRVTRAAMTTDPHAFQASRVPGSRATPLKWD
jgi:hypothetical protein